MTTQYVTCGACGGVLNELPSEELRKRKSSFCCGVLSREFGTQFDAELSMKPQLRYKARHSWSRDPFVEGIQGFDLYRKIGKWMKKVWVVDRKKNLYTEIVMGPNTNEIVHSCEEPLSSHIGHGSAKK
jgi:hypothetical protein